MAAIPTRYKGIRFRSKLEADWARTLDHYGIPWLYEHEGQYFGDVFYLPDFWLVRSQQFLEVKAVWDPESCKKVEALLEHIPPGRFCRGEDDIEIPIVAGLPGGEFFGWARRSGRFRPALRYRDLPPTHDADLALDRELADHDADAEDGFHRHLLDRCRPLWLAKCGGCQGAWFFDPEGQRRCQCCGAPGFAEVLQSPLPWAA